MQSRRSAKGNGYAVREEGDRHGYDEHSKRVIRMVSRISLQKQPPVIDRV